MWERKKCCPFLLLLPSLLLLFSPASVSLTTSSGPRGSRTVIDVEGGPDNVVWVVQLSDLHFSVHDPDRALDFRRLVGPALAMINPSLVLITGDLTDGKSKDLLTMKQNEKEWMEYKNVMQEVVRKSGLDKNIFYDLRGNHDKFGVPVIGGEYDFYNKYSINADAQRNGIVHSITLKNGGWRHLFVGFDSTMVTGIRGPTNIFGHPSDQLLTDIDLELSLWDSDFTDPALTKISFGHFPTTFSAVSNSKRSLKDIFLKHSLSAYICGHLHAGFGKNLKRHHVMGRNFPQSRDSYQLNIHQHSTMKSLGAENCSHESQHAREFWEWEMGDWKKRRAIRIVAIDAGHVSFLDTDFKSEAKKAIIVPTFPLDSRFMTRFSLNNDYNCKYLDTSSYDTVRALVFSETEMNVVSVKIYDSRPGFLSPVLDSTMTKHMENGTRGNLYIAYWNWRAFVDPSPDRYWLQIEAIDILGRSTSSELKPFSINGLSSRVGWKWKEFFVMGLQLEALYRLILLVMLPLLFSLLLIPRAFVIVTNMCITTRRFHVIFSGRKFTGFSIIHFFWILIEFSKLTMIWSFVLGYLLYLIFFSWISGNVFTETGVVGYMSLKGWVVTIPNKNHKCSNIGVPDIMVIVVPHLCFVVLPAILVMSALAAEKAARRDCYLANTGKKWDDYPVDSKRYMKHANHSRIRRFLGRSWIRNILLLACLAILWKHYQLCRILVKAYEMNPFVNSPVYCFSLPLLLVFTVYKTASVPKIG